MSMIVTFFTNVMSTVYVKLNFRISITFDDSNVNTFVRIIIVIINYNHRYYKYIR